MSNLGIFKELEHLGYFYGPTEQIRSEARDSLGDLVDGGSLRPSEKSETSQTHSGAYGLGEFPWHTDGAVSPTPPRWVILSCIINKSKAKTELYLPSNTELESMASLLLRSENSLGQIRYLPAVYKDERVSLMRWDARACPPTSLKFVNMFADVSPYVSINWEENKTLIFDNHRFLHRRTKVVGGNYRLLQREYIY
jgi:hypothetical protein